MPGSTCAEAAQCCGLSMPEHEACLLDRVMTQDQGAYGGFCGNVTDLQLLSCMLSRVCMPPPCCTAQRMDADEGMVTNKQSKPSPLKSKHSQPVCPTASMDG